MNPMHPLQPEGRGDWRRGRRPKGIEMPLFPLNIVLFPDMSLPLHVFEPRYREMIEQCLAGDRIFGVALILEGEEAGGVAQVWPVGTTAVIERSERLPDGRFALIARGITRFHIIERLPDDPYPRALVRMIHEDAQAEADDTLVQEAQSLLMRYLRRITRRQGHDWEDLVMPADPTILSYVVGAVLPCSLDDKQRLLQAPSAGARLLQELPMLRAGVEQMEAEPEGAESRSVHARVARPYEPEIELSAN